MSRLPGQTELTFGLQPAAQLLAAPGREVHRVEQRQLPDGRLIEFVYVMHTYATAGRTYVTWELSRGPVLDCACAATDLADVFCCTACGSLACSRHAATCMADGRVYCSACLVGIAINGMRGIVCRTCAHSIRGSWLSRNWRRLNDWLWG